MTDFNDLPPTNGGSQDDADAQWFCDAVTPVVDATPVPDAWDDIRSRATGESPDVVRLAPTPGRSGRPVRHRLALAAAAVLAVAGIGGALAVSRNDNGGSDETIQATPPTADGTGWYIPEDLPDGWELESVSTDWLDVEGTQEACPCDEIFWSSPDGTASLGVMSAEAEKFNIAEQLGGQVDVEPVVLDGGIDAHAGTAGPYQVVSWVAGDRGWQAASRSVERTALVAAAARVAADPTAPPIDGYRMLSRATTSLDGVRAYHSVTVLLRNADRGISVGYRLEPYGTDVMVTLLAGAVEELGAVDADQPLHKVTIEAANEAAGSSGEVYRAVWFLGQWPGATISAGLEDSTLASGPVSEDDIETVLRSLRTATGDEWQAFLETATGTVDDDARTDRLDDLIVFEGEVAPGVEQSDDWRATRLFVFASSMQSGERPEPMDDLFAPSVAIGLDFETVRTVARPNLSDPQAWVIDETDVERYAGYAPPFSTLERLDATGPFVTEDGPTEGCAQPTPTPPPTAEGQRLVTITPGDVDSCIDWYAVTLVLDDQDRIAGVHLYLREP